MSWDTVELAAVAEINPRMPRELAADLAVSFLPMAAVSEDGQIDYEEERRVAQVRKGYTYFRRGDLLVAKITPCFENGKATKTDRLLEEHGFGSTEFHVIRVDPSKLLPEYAFHLAWNSVFRREGSANMTGSAGQKRVPADFLKRLNIPLPPIEEQRRIAGILDAADALRRRRREAVALLDTLPGAVFAEMFGDPVGKSQKRNFVPLGSITSKIGSGATPRGGAKVYRDEGTKFIRSMNVRDGTFSKEGMVCIDEKAAQQLSNVEVTKDDVFLNITGASVARCCRSDATLTGARVNQHVAIIRPQNPVFTDFIMGALCHPHMRANLLRIAESGATRQAITKPEIEGLEVPAPTENEAEEYSRRLRVLNGARDLVSDQQSELETLFASLQSRAFAGEL